MEWNDIRYFLALSREGTVRAAGASLGVSHSTVARRVEALEAQLSARLFDRNRDGYSLTEVGRLMLPGAERVEREMCALERGSAGKDERLAGPVIVTCCDTFVSDILLGELSSFCIEYPEIELSVGSDSRPFDLAKREADIAIRVLAAGDQPAEYLIGNKLAPLVLANYVALEHAERLDPDLKGSAPRWCSFADRAAHEKLIAQSHYPHVPPWGQFSSVEELVQAARHGLGLAMLPTYAADRDPALRRLKHPDLLHAADVWLLSHPDLRENVRFRATRERVTAAIKRYAPLFHGDGWPNGAPVRPKIAPSGGIKA